MMTPSITILAISTPRIISLSIKTLSIITQSIRAHNIMTLHNDTQYSYTRYFNAQGNDLIHFLMKMHKHFKQNKTIFYRKNQ
jgi:hypothetical protein